MNLMAAYCNGLEDLLMVF